MITNPDDTPWERLSRYLTGELPPGEVEEVERWIAASPEHRVLVDELSAVWRRTGELPDILDPVDVQAAWSRAAVRIAAGARPRRAPVFALPPSLERPRRVTRWAVAAAAVLAVAVGTGLLWRQDIARREAAVVTQPPVGPTYATARGERGAVTLPDGTRLVLAPDSKLRVRDGLRGATREVELEGAAFFQVAHDPDHPFLVHSAGAVTRVLGTEFSVTVYPEQTQVRVLVKNGKVAVRRGDGNKDAAVLTRGQLVRLDPSGQATVVSGIDADRALAWTTGRLEFARRTFGEIVPELERWYDLEITLADPSLAERRVSASFRDETPDQVLAALALLVNARAERSGSMVTFTPIRP